MNRLYRLTLSFILLFGWLFLTPAYSDDPLSIAEQQIIELNKNIEKLNDKAETQKLIDIAEEKYDIALAAKEAMDQASDDYDDAILAKDTALSEKNTAQTAVDNQTLVVATKLQDKNDAKDLLDIANINLSNTPIPNNGAQGVSFQIYPLSRDWYGRAYISEGAGLMCQGSISSLNVWAGWGSICGLSENIIGIFTTTLTIPEGINSVKFAGYTDDGFKLYVDGVLATSQWQEQGSTWSPYTQWFDTSIDKTLELQAWWYNGGGPGNMHVGWGHSGIWTGIPAEYLSYGQPSSQEIIDAYNAAVTAQQAAQATYDDKLSKYNKEVETLQNLTSNLTTAEQNLTTKQQNLTTALNNKNNAIAKYDQSIIDMNNAITDAQNEYNKQWNFEEKQRIAAAVAQALANQPQPTPEPSVEPSQTPGPSPEPSVEPTPEQTKPSDPTPTPTPETTPEATQSPDPTPETSPKPSPEPSPQPTDIDPIPTPEPKPTPAEPSPKPSSNNTSIKELIPENGKGTSEDLSRVIANLTSKDNIVVKLTPEQAAAVAQTLFALSSEAKVEVAKNLGVKSNEVAILAETAKDNPAIAAAIVTFNDRAKENIDAPMPYTVADAITEAQTEQLLSDPLGALTNIDLEKVLNPSEWGKDMTDDQREKAQEVVIPVIIASNIVAAAMTRRI